METIYWMEQNPLVAFICVVYILAMIVGGIFLVLCAFTDCKEDEACKPEKHCGNCKHRTGLYYDNRCAECQKTDPVLPHWEPKTAPGYRS